MPVFGTTKLKSRSCEKRTWYLYKATMENEENRVTLNKYPRGWCQNEFFDERLWEHRTKKITQMGLANSRLTENDWIYEWGCRKIRISWLFKECWSVVSFKLNVGSTWTFNFQHNPADFIWSGALPFNFLLKPSFNVIPSSPVKRSRNYKMNCNPYRRIGNCRSQ